MTQTITLKVSVDCDACKKKVKKALEGIQGVDSVDVDMKNERVTVVGNVEAKVLVKKLAKIGKKVDLPGGHNKGDNHSDNTNMINFGKGGNKNKGGAKGKVASAEDVEGEEEMPHPEVYADIFSDENANSCSIM